MIDFIETLIQDLALLLRDPITFLDTYFFSAPGYNLYNTLVYATVGILAIILVGKIIQLLNRKGSERWRDEFIKIQMDTEFFIAILPYIFIGSTLRALQDIAVQDRIISPYEIFADRVFVTPGVYIVTILLTILIGTLSIVLSQEFFQEINPFNNWRVTFMTLGIIIEAVLFIPIIPLLFAESENLFGGGIILTLTVIFGVVFHLLAKRISGQFFSDVPIRREETLATLTQMFDAFTTVIAIEFFSYQEKHYLPAILFNTPIGAWPFLIIKLGITLLFIWAVRGLENRNLEQWLLWVVFLLGLATGTRDFLRLITNT